MLPPHTGSRPRSRRLCHREHACQRCSAVASCSLKSNVELRFVLLNLSGHQSRRSSTARFAKLEHRGLHGINHDQRGLLSLVHAAIKVLRRP